MTSSLMGDPFIDDVIARGVGEMVGATFGKMEIHEHQARRRPLGHHGFGDNLAAAGVRKMS